MDPPRAKHAPADVNAHLEPYRGTLESVGPRFEALHWRDLREQTERFEAIAEMVPLAGRSIADIGCGRADLLNWLRRHDLAPRRYIGVDALPGLVEFGRRRTRRIRGTTCVVGDFARDADFFRTLGATHRPDVILFSGSLNTYSPRLVRTVLQRAWRSLYSLGSSRLPPVLVFNFLNERAPERPGDPTRSCRAADLVAWALARATEVTSLTGYLAGEDTTIAMSRPRLPAR